MKFSATFSRWAECSGIPMALLALAPPCPVKHVAVLTKNYGPVSTTSCGAVTPDSRLARLKAVLFVVVRTML